MEGRRPLRRHLRRHGERVQPRAEERLVDVDVAEAGEERLVEQQRLQAHPPPRQGRGERLGRPVVAERLRPERAQAVGQLGIVQQRDPPEAADVAEAQLVAVREGERRALEAVARRGVRQDAQLPGHPQVDHQVLAAVQIDDQELGAAADPAHPPPGQPLRQCLRRRRGDRARPFEEAQASEGAADDLPLQAAADRFDFGEFGHRRLSAPTGARRALPSARYFG